MVVSRNSMVELAARRSASLAPAYMPLPSMLGTSPFTRPYRCNREGGGRALVTSCRRGRLAGVPRDGGLCQGHRLGCDQQFRGRRSDAKLFYGQPCLLLDSFAIPRKALSLFTRQKLHVEAREHISNAFLHETHGGTRCW
eukprot:3140995-Pleurochrysis_carterae.AAC.19